jgi:hypothetical protein
MATPSSYPLTNLDIEAEFGVAIDTSGECLGLSTAPSAYPLTSANMLGLSDAPPVPTINFLTGHLNITEGLCSFGSMYLNITTTEVIVGGIDQCEGPIDDSNTFWSGANITDYPDGTFQFRHSGIFSWTGVANDVWHDVPSTGLALTRGRSQSSGLTFELREAANTSNASSFTYSMLPY